MHSIDYSAFDRAISFRESVRAHNGWMIIAGSVAAVLFLVFAVIWGILIDDFGPLLPFGVFASFATFWAVSSYRTAQFSIRMNRFASANGYVYTPNINYDMRPGVLFQQGRNRQFTHVIRSSSNSIAELGNFQFVTGSGKNQQTHVQEFLRIKLPRRLPNMVLDGKQNNLFGKISNLNRGFSGDQKLSLEGDFDKYFTLYAPAQYKSDALYIFTPDVMQSLIDSVDKYDCEVVDDDFYVYGTKALSNAQQVKDLFRIAHTLQPELEKQSRRYSDANVGDFTANTVAEGGKRLKSGLGTWGTIIVVFAIAYFIFSFAGGILPTVVNLFQNAL